MRDISKAYGIVQALHPTTLELARGEVHALVGENGSGKSTLVGIVSGTTKPDSGTVVIDGKECARHTPWESRRNGAATVFQDSSVLPEFTIAQNLYLAAPVDQRPSYRTIEHWAAERLRPYGILDAASVTLRAEALVPAQRQLLEIVGALAAQPSVLLLDEATSALSAEGVNVALTLISRAADLGCAVLFVTHRLSEVFRVADRISVLRDGAWQGTYNARDLDVLRLVELMAGTSVDVEFPERALPEQRGDVAVSATDLTGTGYGPVSLSVRKGEIVGIAGATDNGQRELLRGLAAVDVPDGRLIVNDRPITDYHDAIDSGLIFLSGDRRTESLLTPLTIRENLTIGLLGKLSRLGVISWSREKHFVDDSVKRFGIRLASPDDPISSLSGGNQRKVALGRVLATEPDIVLIDEPTIGVDVRSRMEIYRMLRDSAKRGLAVILVSSDASELAGLCDRIVVISRGIIVAELAGESATEQSIVRAFAGADSSTSTRATARPGSTPGSSTRLIPPLRQFTQLHAEAVRLFLLLLFLVAVGAYAQSQQSTFLSDASLNNILVVAVPLAAVAAAEFLVLFIGGIDISVGATMGATVAVMSFAVQDGPLLSMILISLAIAVGLGVAVGTVNAILVEGILISPIIATIATFAVVQGFGLLLRPTPGGIISLDFVEALGKQVWIFPWVFVMLAGLFILADWGLRSAGFGLRFRAVGLNSQVAYRLGVNATGLRAFAYIACSVTAAIGGILLAGQVGIGDSRVGDSYLLLAIAAPVLGGASFLGGHGTMVGCLLGAVFLALAATLPTTLGLNTAASYFLIGGVTLIAVILYTGSAVVAVRLYVRTAWHKSARVRQAFARSS